MLERTAEASSGASDSSSSSSPSSILRERFLVRAGRRAEGELTDPSTIRALIAGLRSTASASAERSGSLSSSSDVLSPRSRAEKERQELLKHYIEKLLGMKREDIAELSVSSSTNTTASSEDATRYV